MHEYRFWLVYSEPSPYKFPRLFSVHAGSLEEAGRTAAEMHGWQLDSINQDEAWFVLNGIAIQCIVHAM